jgi:hypothetical protein
VRGNASRYPDKRESQKAAEGRLVDYLTNVRPALRGAITVEKIRATHNVTEQVAKYRLQLAQAGWATPSQETEQ